MAIELDIIANIKIIKNKIRGQIQEAIKGTTEKAKNNVKFNNNTGGIVS